MYSSPYEYSIRIMRIKINKFMDIVEKVRENSSEKEKLKKLDFCK